MKKKLTGVLAVLLCAALVLRVRAVNADVREPEIVNYEMGREAALGENIFLDSYEDMNGYFVTVESAHILTYDEFMEKHKESIAASLEEGDSLPDKDSQLFPEMVYEVNILVRNGGTEEKEDCGLAFMNYNLTATDFMLQISDSLYWLVNPGEPSMFMDFRLRPQTSMEFCLPFFFAPSSDAVGPGLGLTEDEVRGAEMYLPVSLYPQQIQIRVEAEE